MKFKHFKLRSWSILETIMNKHNLKQEIEFPTAGLASVPGPKYFGFLVFFATFVSTYMQIELIDSSR